MTTTTTRTAATLSAHEVARSLASFKAHSTMAANKLAAATDREEIGALIEKIAEIEARALVFVATLTH